ncbi:MAG: hypothetical protein COC01_04820 [Bacteroidetes bacterium]|nr:hypothetical protein [Bacteroidia bacterium]PCH67895.1 MAG: hypothetical protein COC01_04820 [Bacteroidota bacterium]
MEEKDLKELWQRSVTADNIRLEQSTLLKDLSKKLNSLEKAVKRRDRLEISAAVFVAVAFIPIAITAPSLISMIGAGLVIPSSLFVIFKLLEVKKYQKLKGLAKSLKEHLIQQRDFLGKQKALLDTVLYWYILPPAVGITMYVVGLNSTLSALIIRLSVLLVMYIAVYFLNKYAVKKDIIPLLEKTKLAISEIEE